MEMYLSSLQDLYSPIQSSMNLIALSASWDDPSRETKQEPIF